MNIVPICMLLMPKNWSARIPEFLRCKALGVMQDFLMYPPDDVSSSLESNPLLSSSKHVFKIIGLLRQVSA